MSNRRLTAVKFYKGKVHLTFMCLHACVLCVCKSYKLLRLAFVAHIEIKHLSFGSPQEVYEVLVLHLEDVLGHDGLTCYEHSYDDVRGLFRFDLTKPGNLQRYHVRNYTAKAIQSLIVKPSCNCQSMSGRRAHGPV